MKRIFTIFFILFIGISSIQAQSIYAIRESMDFFRTNEMLTSDNGVNLSAKDIKGSPYLEDDFIVGSIYTAQKLQFNDIPLRYNIFNDNLEFRTPKDQILALSAPEIVEKAQFGEYTMSYIPYVTSKKMKRGFFQVIIEGNASLYVRSTVIYQAPKEAAAYKDPEPAKFLERPDTYYIRIGMEAAYKAGNKKEVIAMFSNHEEEITTFIKKNKIKINKVDGLEKLVEYYNTL